MVEKKSAGMRKKCVECSNFIHLKKDHHVQIHTLNRVKSKDDIAFFHFNCWTNYFNNAVENKMKDKVSMMQNQAIELFNSPELKELFEQIQGAEMLSKMIKINLNPQKIVSKKKVEKKIQDERKSKIKRSGKKRKTQVR